MSEEARKLLDSIESDTLIGLRDRALIGAIVYSFARVSAASTIGDYFQHRKRWWRRPILLPFEIEPPIVQGRRTSEVANADEQRPEEVQRWTCQRFRRQGRVCRHPIIQLPD